MKYTNDEVMELLDKSVKLLQITVLINGENMTCKVQGEKINDEKLILSCMAVREAIQEILERQGISYDEFEDIATLFKKEKAVVELRNKEVLN